MLSIWAVLQTPIFNKAERSMRDYESDIWKITAISGEGDGFFYSVDINGLGYGNFSTKRSGGFYF